MNKFLKMCATLLLVLLILACSAEPDDKALGLAILEVSPTAQGIFIDDDFQYVAKFIDARGDEQVNVEINWFSSDEGVATISELGKVTGISAGRTQISANVNTDGSGITESNIVELTVVVDAATPAKVIINNTATEFMIGSEVQLSAEVFNANDSILAGEAVVWLSDDEAIATIDDTGLVSLLAAGSVNITATADNAISPVFTLTVRIEDNQRVASFQSVGGYSISGLGTLQVTAEGKLEVAFSEDFSVENGPGLEVFLSNTPSPTQSSVNLGSLQSTSGSQTYAVPTNVLIGDYEWVIIHCVPFDLVFGRGQFPDS